jgi:hypothetical protein
MKPEEQPLHATAFEPLYKPGEQGVHVGAPPEETNPALQETQFEDPESRWYVPGEQSTQSACLSKLYFPAKQAVQADVAELNE